MFGLKSKKKGVSETAIIFDIGSASVGAALVQLQDPGKPKILYSTRKDMNFVQDITSERLISGMRSSMESAALDLQKSGVAKHGGRNIKKIYCVFSAPWYVSQTKTVHSSFNKDKTITDSHIDKIVKNEEIEFVDTASSEYANKKKEELHILEHNIVQMRLNGYEVTDAHGKRAKSLDLSIFMSMIPDVAAQTAIKAVSKVFHTENLHMHSFGLASYSVLRSIFADTDDFILVDVSGEVTDVLLVKDDVLIESATFPFGKNKLARDLSKSIGTTPEEAISRVVLHGKGDVEGVVVLGKTQELVSGLKDKWNASLQMILKDFSRDYPIPQKLFFLADENVTPLFKHFIETGSVSNFISPEGTFTATPVENKLFNEYVEYGVDVKKDPFLSIEAVFFNSAHKPHD